MSDIENYKARVEKILNYYIGKLNEWELSFLESLQIQIENYPDNFPTEKQIEKLNQINRRLTK